MTISYKYKYAYVLKHLFHLEAMIDGILPKLRQTPPWHNPDTAGSHYILICSLKAQQVQINE